MMFLLQKITIENCTEIKHDRFNTFFQTVNISNLEKNDQGNYICRVIDENFNTKVAVHFLHVEG